MREKNNFGMV